MSFADGIARGNAGVGAKPALLIGAILTAAAQIACPATDTTTFSVSATISPACDVSAANLSFGTYNAAAASPLDATSTISVYCTSGTGYTIALDVGTSGGTFVARTIANGGSTLDYNLYTTAARTTVWGDGSGSTNTVAGTGAGLLSANSHTVYGRVATAQDQPPGAYTSTITVTVSF